jgi:nucleoside-diphosphate-sugar epimerase
VPATFAGVSKARRLPGHGPKTRIEQGIAGFVEWFKQQA